MKNSDSTKAETGLEKYPVHIQQALFLIAAVLRRIKEKRLDKGGEKRLINDQAEGGENLEN